VERREGSKPLPATPIVMDQRGCMYTPHAFAFRAGTPFEVKNSDDTDHNVHYMGDGNKQGGKDNISQSKGAPNIKWPLANAEPGPAGFKCDVHAWMSAYMRIVDHDSYMLTGKDGLFELKDLPPGEYTVNAWHESFDKPVSKKITVEPGKTMDWNPVFKF
jgi:plastocyanin